MMKGKDWETDEGENRLAKKIIAEALQARAEEMVNRIGSDKYDIHAISTSERKDDTIHTMFMTNWEGDTIYVFYQSAKNRSGQR
jgi:predicted transcriptional regulator of viral defense system